MTKIVKICKKHGTLKRSQIIIHYQCRQCINLYNRDLYKEQVINLSERYLKSYCVKKYSLESRTDVTTEMMDSAREHLIKKRQRLAKNK